MIKLKLSSSPPVCDQEIIKTTSNATAPMTRPPFLVICELMVVLLDPPGAHTPEAKQWATLLKTK
jgi:hypothetical protein